MDDNLLDRVYQAILNHDTKFDGVYYVGIKSTGIVCRPSCRSRTPKKENIRIFHSIEIAREAGFRACKRCRPDDPCRHGPDKQLAEQVKDLILSNYSSPLTLASIALQLNVSPYHLQRVFKRATGITPARYLHDTRIDQAGRLLRQTGYTIQEIALKVGFRSVPHFTSAFRKAAGCIPSKYREHKQGDQSNEKHSGGFVLGIRDI